MIHIFKTWTIRPDGREYIAKRVIYEGEVILCLYVPYHTNTPTNPVHCTY